MRWSPDARGRLERAAFELFAEQGYQATTVPQITARAGLTTRTFFRYFADKREVIFAGAEIPDLARTAIEGAPAGIDPLDIVMHGLRTVADERFEGRHGEVGSVRRLVLSESSLRERDARKRADLTDAVREAFVSRGLDPSEAAVIAETTVMLFHLALEAWLTGPAERRMADVVDEQLSALRGVLDRRPAAS
ncbi:TetR family transcriptional regulator [Curtobacterium aurantiacum]|uniref:TetR family transcriptional regulator n=1 Tax=Curtobacterium aurantiacum TaxID=3236919 RepID=A0ABS5VE54_9MICO|nr:TetR family transcriptional regulator [Curtobacterium flaccumfaciens]MBT1544383.1 TetR family transcriptional regulator [Curtobacterium flaccumfaciens pv. flaccumfaciens]MBT1587211.1 TetR family transcriptional regulator [Curtobacterium flaccumfaciens pv. flaccumfaciens]